MSSFEHVWGDTKRTGGMAFPDPGRAQSAKQREQLTETGMTLRDYFAAHAPAAPEDFGWAPGECDSWQRSSRWAYVYADAMLAARSAA